MRHPDLKLKIPAQVFCMSWCDLTLSSGGVQAPRWSPRRWFTKASTGTCWQGRLSATIEGLCTSGGSAR